MPKVSVIIPTHNRAETLRAAIGSVLTQSYTDFEVIVVDDNSSDHTASVVEGIGDFRIRYMRHERNRGEGASRNTGLRNATGEFVAFLDDDDVWLPEKLKRQVDLLEASPSGVGAVYTGFYKIDKSTSREWGRVCPQRKGNILEDMLADNWIATSALLLRKECFEKAGLFEEGMRFGADYDMWLRVAQIFEFECISEPLVIYYIHGNNVTSNYEAVIKGLEIQLERYSSLWASNRKALSRRYASLGVLYCYSGDVEKGRSAFRKGIRLSPIQIRTYFSLLLSFLGPAPFRHLTDLKDALILRRGPRISASSKG